MAPPVLAPDAQLAIVPLVFRDLVLHGGSLPPSSQGKLGANRCELNLGQRSTISFGKEKTRKKKEFFCF
jgi:hypothetical protein